MEIVKKKRPPYVYFGIFVVLLALTAISVGLFKTEVVNETQNPPPVDRSDINR